MQRLPRSLRWLFVVQVGLVCAQARAATATNDADSDAVAEVDETIATPPTAAPGDPSTAAADATESRPAWGASTGQSPATPTPRRSTVLATGLSALFPGIGHFYLDDRGTGATLMIGGALSLGTWLGLSLGTEVDDPASSADAVSDLAFLTYQNIFFYGLYAAYRDARAFNAQHGRGVAMRPTTFAELTLAPFNPAVLSKPEVGLGIVLTSVAGVVAGLLSAGAQPDRPNIFRRQTVPLIGVEVSPPVGAFAAASYYGAMFGAVAVGEEAFFRGYLQSSLSAQFGPFAGWFAATVLFGLAHAPNALLLEDEGERQRYLLHAVPFITALGGYFGWVYADAGDDLLPVVALHFWYDVIVSAVGYALDPEDAPFAIRIGGDF